MNELKIEYLKTKDVIPYENNPRKNDAAVEYVANSIKEFGFKVPIIIDKNNVIVAGHTRIKAAEQLGIKEVPCIRADDLTDEQIKAFRVADNKVSELAEWDFDKLNIELRDMEIDLSQFSFKPEKLGFFETDDHGGAERQEGNEEYNAFLDKFELAKTTDDCYTPPKIYDAVAEWVENEYGVNRKNFVRPFYPGGDYENEKYKPDDIVVDNPPFSILSEIIKFYYERGIRFFLFAPGLTVFSSSSSCSVCVGYPLIFENGASVNTSFVTNLEDARFRSAPTLYKALDDAMKATLAETKSELPKYSYPDCVVTAPMIAKFSKYGVDYKVSKKESYRVSGLDAQKECGKAIFGAGYLIAEKAAAEKAAAEKAAAEKAAAEKAAAEKAAATRWALSEREIEIIKSLGA